MAEAPPTIVLTVITGPRGSGKSQLINRLRARGGEATLAMANEQGTTALQGQVRDMPAQIADTCLCCRFGAFTGVLEQLLRDIDNGRLQRPDNLLFETSGTADPVLLLSEVIRHPYLSRRYRIGAVAMPLAGQPQQPLPQELALQLEGCSVLVGDAAPWQAIIDRLNPHAAVIATDAAHALLSARFDISQRNEAARRRLYASNRRPLARNL